MSRSTPCMLAVLGLTSVAVAQSIAPHTLFRPVTSPIRNAGVYHLGTGTWTRRADATNASNWDVVYANTCPSRYYFGEFQHEVACDEGRVPGPNGPVVCDTGLLSRNVGCSCAYMITGFQIGYCTSLPSNVTFNVGFQDAYFPCAVPATNHGPFTLTGLPGAGGAAQACWLVTIDLSASGQRFAMNADGASCTWGFDDLSTHHVFGWTFENLNNVQNTLTDFAGPLVAGDFYPPSHCSMVDGTRWDTLTCPSQGGQHAKWPNNLTEDGWGMDSQSVFRDDTTIPGGHVSGFNGPGCYSVQPQSINFHLRVFADTGCPLPAPGVAECRPWVDFAFNCPCAGPPANNPTTFGAGCNALTNPGPTQTGGAVLAASGTSSVSGATPGVDTLALTVTGLPTSASESAMLIQGTLLGPAIVFGQGLRCVSGHLKRIQIHSTATGGSTWPAPGDFQPTIQARSAQLGDPLAPGFVRHYFVHYRQSLFEPGCSFPSNFNASNARGIDWSP